MTVKANRYFGHTFGIVSENVTCHCCPKHCSFMWDVQKYFNGASKFSVA